MIVGDFHFVGVAIAPSEADAKLVVDPYAVLTIAVALQSFQSVARRQHEVAERNRGMKHLQFLQRRLVDIGRNSPTPLFVP